MRKRIFTTIALALAGFALLGSTSASAGGAPSSSETTARPTAAVKQKVERNEAKQHQMTGYSKECHAVGDVEGCFMPYGDILWLDDKGLDGEPVKLLWWDVHPDGPRLGVCTGSQGFNGGWARCNKDLPENHQIKWKVSWWDNGQWHNSKAFYTRA